MNRLFIGGMLLVTTVCSCASIPRLPPLKREAVRHSDRGIAAEGRNDTAAALAEFAEAYRLHASIENHGGMAAALLNIARVQVRTGEAAERRRTMDLLLPLRDKVPGELAREIDFEGARLLLSEGRREEAAALCREALAGTLLRRGRMENLLGEILLAQGKYAALAGQAQAALAASRKEGDRREEANSLRLLGEAALAGGGWREAEERFTAALSVDRELALPAKVAADLRGIARSCGGRGEADGALSGWKRAYAAALAAGDLSGAAGDLTRMAELYEASGKSAEAAEMRRLRERLLPREQ